MHGQGDLLVMTLIRVLSFQRCALRYLLLLAMLVEMLSSRSNMPSMQFSRRTTRVSADDNSASSFGLLEDNKSVSAIDFMAEISLWTLFSTETKRSSNPSMARANSC